MLLKALTQQYIKRYLLQYYLLQFFKSKRDSVWVRLKQRLSKIIEHTDFYRTSNKLWVSIKRGVYQNIAVRDIIYVKAANHYLEVHCCNEKIYIVKSSLTKFYDKHLSLYSVFYQLSRSYLVNIDKVNKIERNRLLLDENKTLPIPKKKREELLVKIGIKIEHKK